MKLLSTKISEDNLLPDRLIEMSTKVLRRGSSSGETLPAPRQQLRRHRASTFDVIPGFQGLIGSISVAPEQGALSCCALSTANFCFDNAEISV
ncbi:MAG: hypothetical protein AUG51_18530 [Acidobacteria bacterium 13_1_20CM_3_53_8]|nr:MAG: hypothetical protein AUG51_18530 [Acidobacteria bacterium 13_1_20CM_3_53_8]